MVSSTSSSEPLRLFGRVLLFSMLPILVLVASFAWGPHGTRIDYMGALVQKHARLEALPSPKVIIVGGSNSAFGIDSERLEEALCLQVVNMSIHASLGFRFMVEEVKEHIGAGDLVIVALEHSAFSEPDKTNDIHTITVDRYPEALDHVHWYMRPKVLSGIAIMRFQGAWKEANGAWKGEGLDPVYRANGFNVQGDVISHLDRPTRRPETLERIPHELPMVSPEFASLVDTLKTRVSAAGGKLVFVWPPIAVTSFRPEFHEAMQDALLEQGYRMVGSTMDYVLPDTAFYDTHHHLNARGRQERTTLLIRDLCGTEGIRCCVADATQP